MRDQTDTNRIHYISNTLFMWVIKLIWILIFKVETKRSLSSRLLTADHIGLVAKFSLTYIELVKLHYFLFRIIDVVRVVNIPKYVHNVSIHYDVLHRNNCDCGVGGGGAPEAVQNITNIGSLDKFEVAGREVRHNSEN